MMKSLTQLLIWSLVYNAPPVSAASSPNPTDFVDLFIGTEGPVPGTAYNGGNIFPGAAFPHGAVKIGIDTTEYNQSTDATAGYTPDGNVTAITMLHESGTGGAPKYGIIPQMPLTTLDKVNVMDNLTYMQPRIAKDQATVGRFTTHLANGVVSDMSASHHAGLMRYQYPSNTSRLLLVDLSHYLPTNDEVVAAQFYSNAHIDVAPDRTAYSGYGVYRGGWNEGPDYTVYFYAEFDRPAESHQLWHGPPTDPYWPNNTDYAIPTFINSSSLDGGVAGYNYADRIGAVFQFPANVSEVRSKVGVSWISVDRARSYLDEIPGFDLDKTQAAVRDAWNSQVLSKVTVPTTNRTRATMLYSALYHSHLLPSNRTGENPNWATDEPVFDDFYTAWDTFRCLNSFYLLTDPPLAEGIVRALIDIWRHEGYMPDGRSSFYNGRVQGGSNADNILADAYVKGLRGGINWTDGYAAMRRDAEVMPYNNFDPEDLTQSTKQGRGGLDDWKSLGFVSVNYGRALSKTIEYALNDYAVAQVAHGEASADFAKYLNRSANWQNIWRPNITSLNFTGFLAPLYPNSTIQQPYDPLSCGACEWDSIAYEALPWEYSWTVPFDMATLIRLMGGPNRTEQRLDAMFAPNLKGGAAVGSGGTNGIGNTLFNPGNEPSFATPFLYNYLPGKQHKSVLRSRQVVDQYYNDGPSGLPGNSDAGAIDSWLVWNLLGLYPVVTQDVYLLLAPRFENASVAVGDSGRLNISTTGMPSDPEAVAYVQSVRVNGAPWNRSWVTHEDLVQGGKGGRLDFVLGTEPFSRDVGDVPPSPGHLDKGLEVV